MWWIALALGLLGLILIGPLVEALVEPRIVGDAISDVAFWVVVIVLVRGAVVLAMRALRRR